jgi:hypothetical protein
MRGTLLILNIAAALAVGAAAAAAAPASYPPEVQAVLDAARAECRDTGEGETKGELKPGRNIVRKLDLTGDGRADYIVSFEDTTCSTFESYFCGTGGCELTILVAKRGGQLVNVYSGRVHKYDLLPGHKIRFWMHGGYCGRAGASTCTKTRRISETPFKIEQPQ